MISFPENEFPTIKIDRFRILKFFLRLWAGEGKLMTLTLIMFLVKLSGYLGRTFFILTATIDDDFFLEIASTYPVAFIAVVKLTFLMINRKNVKFLFSAVTENFWDISIAGADLENKLKKRFKFFNFLLLSHFTASMNFVVMHTSFSTVPIPEGRSRWLPSLISFPLDPDRSPVYEILYVVLLWNLFVTVIGNAIYDFIFVYAAQHLCVQFMLLEQVLGHLTSGLMEERDDVQRFHSREFQKSVHGRIKLCVRHHNILIQYGSELERYSSFLLGLQLFTTFCVIVITGYSLTQDFRITKESILNLSLVFSIIVQFIIYALQCTEIEEKSRSVVDAAYQCQWYLFKAPFKRGLTLLLMNGQKGITMKGAGLIEINNTILVALFQKVFSTITLLNSLQDSTKN